jgi:isoleucyl-tRNA synthetase
MDYKSTLNLPQTEFAMKAELPEREPLFQKHWEEIDIYKQILKKSRGKPKYILHDGPPYANGDIHIGHALNKTLKDIIVKYKTMKGYDSSYVPGWDCHGLPIEYSLFKELGIGKNEITRQEFRKKAYDYAMKYVSIQREQFKRLGVFGNWDNPYLTLSPDYEESILTAFLELVKKGYIYHGLKPVNWCFKCETALAEAEVEYEERPSPSIFVKFKLIDEPAYLLIWTTTPWTLMANVAVAVHPELIYSYIKTDKGDLIIAKDLLNYTLARIGIDRYEIIKEIKGKGLEGLVYLHPFGLRNGGVVLADYVSKEEGTGLIHTAPGHGNEDYLTGLKYKLEIIMPVDEKGIFDASSGEFKGMNVFKANELIIEKLKKEGALLSKTEISHSYPHCWRCKNPIIFRATNQWFLSMEHRDLRKKLAFVIKNAVQWLPESGKERILSMVELRPDWCLSRQRYWGVPIPALICNDCENEFLSQEVIEKFIKQVLKEGSDSWFSGNLADFLPENFRCPACKSNNLSKGTDILDVWFDSGVSFHAVLKKRKELEFPCALYLEGSDQHRGWFQSSLIPSMCIDGIAPFKAVLTHGFVVDGEGKKMSKSLGNVISPQDIIKDYGADILRLWVASSDYNEDIRISFTILSRLREAYRKIRNTVRFIISNLYDFNPDEDKVDYDNLRKIDKLILWKLHQEFLPSLENNFDKFEFYKAYKSIYDFCNEELSMNYLDMIKGRLYTYGADSLERRAVQTVIYEILNTLVRVVSPIIPFTAEDIWRNFPKRKIDSSIVSVHLLDWPGVNPVFAQANLNLKKNINTELQTILELVPDITKALEEERKTGLIGSSFDAKINLLTNNEIRYKYLESLEKDLLEIFKVSQIQITKKDNLEGAVRSKKYSDIAIEIEKASGLKCVRCWNYSSSIGKSKIHPLICETCLKAIEER